MQKRIKLTLEKSDNFAVEQLMFLLTQLLYRSVVSDSLRFEWFDRDSYDCSSPTNPKRFSIISNSFNKGMK